jgi:hypothetical protein
VKEICENIAGSTGCMCSKVHLQGPALLHETGTISSFVEFREHHTLPWEVFRKWESKCPEVLRLTDESLARLRGGKCDLKGRARCNLKADLGCNFTRGRAK